MFFFVRGDDDDGDDNDELGDENAAGKNENGILFRLISNFCFTVSVEALTAADAKLTRDIEKRSVFIASIPRKKN